MCEPKLAAKQVTAYVRPVVAPCVWLGIVVAVHPTYSSASVVVVSFLRLASQPLTSVALRASCLLF